MTEDEIDVVARLVREEVERATAGLRKPSGGDGLSQLAAELRELRGELTASRTVQNPATDGVDSLLSSVERFGKLAGELGFKRGDDPGLAGIAVEAIKAVSPAVAPFMRLWSARALREEVVARAVAKKQGIPLVEDDDGGEVDGAELVPAGGASDGAE